MKKRLFYILLALLYCLSLFVLIPVRLALALVDKKSG